MNRVMKDVSDKRFVCNTINKHNGISPEIDQIKLLNQIRERSEDEDKDKITLQCHCAGCLLVRDDTLIKGLPMQVHESFDQDWLEENGYVGIYRR